jgi:hypothetical protein
MAMSRSTLSRAAPVRSTNRARTVSVSAVNAQSLRSAAQKAAAIAATVALAMVSYPDF